MEIMSGSGHNAEPDPGILPTDLLKVPRFDYRIMPGSDEKQRERITGKKLPQIP